MMSCLKLTHGFTGKALTMQTLIERHLSKIQGVISCFDRVILTGTILERLEKTADMIQADKRILISRTEQCQSSETSVSCNLPYLLERIDAE